MHDVTTISASFSTDGIVVFSRLVAVSVFGDEHAEYYGLYASSGAAEQVNYCLRRCFWDATFGAAEQVLRSLSAQTLFFNAESLDVNHRAIVIASDVDAKDEYQIRSAPSFDDSFIGKQISYFVSDDKKELRGTYNGGSSTSPAIERLFHDLCAVFQALATGQAVDSLPDTLRLSYSFFSISDMLQFGERSE